MGSIEELCVKPSLYKDEGWTGRSNNHVFVVMKKK